MFYYLGKCKVFLGAALINVLDVFIPRLYFSGKRVLQFLVLLLFCVFRLFAFLP